MPTAAPMPELTALLRDIDAKRELAEKLQESLEHHQHAIRTIGEEAVAVQRCVALGGCCKLLSISKLHFNMHDVVLDDTHKCRCHHLNQPQLAHNDTMKTCGLLKLNHF